MVCGRDQPASLYGKNRLRIALYVGDDTADDPNELVEGNYRLRDWLVVILPDYSYLGYPFVVQFSISKRWN
jgi:hypothetical protein